ncbi:MAG: hypothetical protein ABH871_07770 [Pseudomonadota bacterium]
MKYAAFIIITAMFICIPLFGQENKTEDASTGAAANAEAAAGCEKLNLGSWEGVETEEGAAEVVEGDAATDEQYLSDKQLYEQSQQQQQQQQKTEELLCEENPNPDGTITCYEGDNALTCQVQGEQILCPQ